MNGLHYLVASGKVRYLVSFNARLQHTYVSAHCFIQGISDTPAWIVTKANMYARMTGKTPFSVYQGGWSILLRDFEREIIPMTREEGKYYPYYRRSVTDGSVQAWLLRHLAFWEEVEFERTRKKSDASRVGRRVRFSLHYPVHYVLRPGYP